MVRYELTSNGAVVVSMPDASEEFGITHMDALAEVLSVYNVHANIRLVRYDEDGVHEVAARTIWEHELMPPDIAAATRKDSNR